VIGHDSRGASPAHHPSSEEAKEATPSFLEKDPLHLLVLVPEGVMYADSSQPFAFETQDDGTTHSQVVPLNQ
jgi:hypothetical protein